MIDDLGNAGEAAHGEVIGHEEPVEAQGIQGTGHGDQSVALQSFGSGHNRHLSFSYVWGKAGLYNKVNCSSPRSSGLRMAPAAGMVRVR